VGVAVARDLMLSARRFDAEEAVRLGVISRMVAHDDRVEPVIDRTRNRVGKRGRGRVIYQEARFPGQDRFERARKCRRARSVFPQKATVASTPHMRGSEINVNGVPNVSVVMLFTPVTYWSSSTLVT